MDNIMIDNNSNNSNDNDNNINNVVDQEAAEAVLATEANANMQLPIDLRVERRAKKDYYHRYIEK